eukprot:scaffold7488_cov444-Prasinococcus_capsulatus_cf.AAC.3
MLTHVGERQVLEEVFQMQAHMALPDEDVQAARKTLVQLKENLPLPRVLRNVHHDAIDDDGIQGVQLSQNCTGACCEVLYSTLGITKWPTADRLTYRIPDPSQPPPAFGVCFMHFYHSAHFSANSTKWTIANVLLLKEAGGMQTQEGAERVDYVIPLYERKHRHGDRAIWQASPEELMVDVLKSESDYLKAYPQHPCGSYVAWIGKIQSLNRSPFHVSTYAGGQTVLNGSFAASTPVSPP